MYIRIHTSIYLYLCTYLSVYLAPAAPAEDARIETEAQGKARGRDKHSRTNMCIYIYIYIYI